jgi:hypothetical protein
MLETYTFCVRFRLWGFDVSIGMHSAAGEPLAVGDALFGRTRRALLALLFGRCGRAFHLGELVRATGFGRGHVQRELERLVACELATREARGNRLLYKANQASPVCHDLVQFVVATFGLADPLREALAPLAARIELALVVGPAAAGRTISDVHLVVVGHVARDELDAVLAKASRSVVRRIVPWLTDRATFARHRARWHDQRTLVLLGHFEPAKPLIPIGRRGPHQPRSIGADGAGPPLQ